MVSYIEHSPPSPAYIAWNGSPEDYPYNTLIGCFYTLRAARRACVKYDQGRAHQESGKAPVVWRSIESEDVRKRIAELEKELGLPGSSLT